LSHNSLLSDVVNQVRGDWLGHTQQRCTVVISETPHLNTQVG